jgi:CRP-like cAMP-binding protein
MKILTILKALPSFSNFTDAELESLTQNFEFRVFGRDELILNEDSVNDALYIIVKGIVEIRKTFNGEQFPVAELCAGSFFGEGGVVGFTSHKAMAIAVALTDTELLSFPKHAVEKLTNEQPAVAAKFLRMLTIIVSSKLRRINEEYVRMFLQYRGLKNAHEMKAFSESFNAKELIL